MNQSDAKEDEATCAKRSKIAQRVPLKRGKKMARKKDDAGKMAVTSVGQTLICAKNDKHANNEGRCSTQLAGEYRFKTRSKIGWLYSQLVDKIFMCVLIG